jgi:hypothetical protein
MKKSLIAIVVAAVLVGVVSVAGSVYAQSPTPETWTPGQGYGNRAQLYTEDGLGIYHDELMAVFSEALGISVEDLEARIDAGETLMQIALAEGMTFDEIKALMPVGSFGAMSQFGHGYRYTNLDGEFVPGANCDGSCLEDGEYVPQYLGPQPGAGLGRGARGGGRR